MRVTNSMMISNLLRDLHKNNRLMEDSNRKLSSGKDFRLPGENPIGTSKSMILNTGINKNTKYIKNMDEGIAWLEYTDDALGDVTTLLIRARELAVYGANDIHDETSRLGIAEEMDALRDSIHQISNFDYAGRYIFSGEKTDTKPYTPNGAFHGNENYFRIEVGPGNYMAINLPGNEVFGKNEDVVPYSQDSLITMLEIISRDLRGQGEIRNLTKGIDSRLGMLNGEEIQEGNYSLNITRNYSSTIPISSSVIEEQNFLRGDDRPVSFFGGSMGVTAGYDNGNPQGDSPYSGSLQLEVREIDASTNTLSVLAKGHLYDQDGNYYYLEDELDMDMGAVANGSILQISKDSLNGVHDLVLYSTINRDGILSDTYGVGDRAILSLSSAVQEDVYYDKMEVSVSPQLDKNTITYTYYFQAGALNQKYEDDDFHLRFYSLTQGVGTSFDGRLELRFDELRTGNLSFEYKKGRIGDRIANLDDYIETILTTRAALGGKVHRLELNKNYLTSHDLRLRYLLSENEDADIAATILQLKIQETIHRSALASGARMIQPSLIDFLR